MRLMRYLAMTLGAVLGTLLVVWVVRYRRVTSPGGDGYYRSFHNWIELK